MNKKYSKRDPIKDYFPLPNEIFCLGLSYREIAVYSYLPYRMVHRNKGFNYQGMLIYLMAMYAFYSVITAVVNLVKFRKHGSPILPAAKAINLVAAMISILSLETEMLAQFGGDDEFRSVMTSATGGGVCTITIGIAIFMNVKSTRKLKAPMAQNSQEVENYE